MGEKNNQSIVLRILFLGIGKDEVKDGGNGVVGSPVSVPNHLA